MAFQFRCRTCDQIHHGVPTFGFDAPAIANAIPAAERDRRVALGTDDCVVDERRFLVRGCLEIPVEGETDPFVWGVWVDISRGDFDKWAAAFHLEQREHIGPFAGYLGSVLPCYPDTFNHHVVIHLRDKGLRPLVKLAQSAHPLHLEQCNGITQERLADIYTTVMHGAAR